MENAMCTLSRRHLLQLSAAAALYAGFQGAARTPQARAQADAWRLAPQVTPGPQYDLLIQGGEVLDPSQGMRGLHDVAIQRGRIVAVAPDLPDERARQVLSAAGRLVVPGLVDLHAHMYPQGRGPAGLVPDELTPATGTTTVVSAGDAGANTFAGFDQLIVPRSRTRVFAFLHIASFGLGGAPWEMADIRQASIEAAARTVAENADVLIGVKVRQSAAAVGSNGLEPLRRAIAAAELSGTGARVMCHIGDVPGDLADLLDLMRPGDIVTHLYSGQGNDVVRDGRVLAAAFDAQARGVIMDVGHGALSFDYTVAEPAIEQGLLPDVISSDLHGGSINTPGRPYLPWVMSKLLNLGLTLEQVVAMATINPARVIGRVEGLGTLRVGAPADVTLLELVQQPVEFVDARINTRRGDRFLRATDTVRAGAPVRRPYPSPLTYPSR
jgi:dihydroorotase